MSKRLDGLLERISKIRGAEKITPEIVEKMQNLCESKLLFKALKDLLDYHEESNMSIAITNVIVANGKCGVIAMQNSVLGKISVGWSFSKTSGFRIVDEKFFADNVFAPSQRRAYSIGTP